MTLSEFLLARIAERESEILNGWDSDGRARIATMWTGGEPGYTTVASDHGDDAWIADGHEVEDPRYVHVLFDPARELARCKADRQLLELHADNGSIPGRYELRCFACDADYPCDTLKIMALPYAGHPDYHPGWRS